MVDRRFWAILTVLALPCVASSLPAWWSELPRLERMESRFVQTSESAVFGNLERKGKLQMAKGGMLRVAYDRGLLVVADGRTLTQYDPGARTAQTLSLRTAAADVPLLNVLLDLSALESSYRIVPMGGEKVHLEPKRVGLPKVDLEGQAGMLRSIAWLDGTGAQQKLVLQDPHVPPRFPEGTFLFKAPSGTRWLGRK